MKKSAKAVLRENLLAFVTKGKPLAPHETGVGRLVALGVARGTAQRLLDPDRDVQLETLDQVADLTRMKPWQLLVPGDQKDALSELVESIELSPKAKSLAERYDSIRSSEARQVGYALIDQVLQQAEWLDRPTADQPATTAPGPARKTKPDPHQ